MWIYIGLYVLTVIFCVLETNVDMIIVCDKQLKIADIAFAVLCTYILLLGIMRGELLGVDSGNYKNFYLEVCNSDNFQDVAFRLQDYGYTAVNWVISRFVSPFWAFRAVLFSISFLSIAIWIKKHSQHVSMSFLLYLSLGFLTFDFTILRQALAVSIYIWSYDFLMARKAACFLGLVLLAALFHRTALFMLAVYPLLTFKSQNGERITRFIYFFGAIGMVWVADEWVAFIYRQNDYSQIVGKGGGKSLLLYYIFLFLLLYFMKEKMHGGKDVTVEYQLSASTVYFQIIATAVSIATRVLKYSTTYLFILIPDIMDIQDRKSKNTVMVLLIIFFSVLYVREFGSGDIVPYVTWF